VTQFDRVPTVITQETATYQRLSTTAVRGGNHDVELMLEETANALVDFQRQQARRDLLRASAQASEKAVSLARLRYQFGATDFLTVLDAERTLLNAQDLLAASETRTATTLIAIYKALGGGWEVQG
jgi:multidrug efflux system outer membrane protein